MILITEIVVLVFVFHHSKYSCLQKRSKFIYADKFPAKTPRVKYF